MCVKILKNPVQKSVRFFATKTLNLSIANTWPHIAKIINAKKPSKATLAKTICITNFLLDAPLTVYLTNKMNKGLVSEQKNNTSPQKKCRMEVKHG